MDSFESIVAKHKQDLAAKRNLVAQQAAALTEKNNRIAQLMPTVFHEAQIVARALRMDPRELSHPAMSSTVLAQIYNSTAAKGHSGGLSGHGYPPSDRAYRRAAKRFAEAVEGRTFPIYDLGCRYTWDYRDMNGEPSSSTESYGIGSQGKLYVLNAMFNDIRGVSELQLQSDFDGDNERRLNTIRDGLGLVVAKYNLQLEI